MKKRRQRIIYWRGFEKEGGRAIRTNRKKEAGRVIAAALVGSV